MSEQVCKSVWSTFVQTLLTTIYISLFQALASSEIISLSEVIYCMSQECPPPRDNGGMTRTHERIWFVQGSFFSGFGSKLRASRKLSLSYVNILVRSTPNRPLWFNFTIYTWLCHMTNSLLVKWKNCVLGRIHFRVVRLWPTSKGETHSRG